MSPELVGEFNWFEVCWHIRFMALGSGKPPHGRRVTVVGIEGLQVDKSRNTIVSPSSVCIDSWPLDNVHKRAVWIFDNGAMGGGTSYRTVVQPSHLR